MNSFLVLSNGRRGPSKLTRVSVLAASWLASPKKARRSMRLAGIGNLAIASVMAVSMLYPSWDSWNPANVTCDWAYSHLSWLSDHMFGTSLETCVVCLVSSLS